MPACVFDRRSKALALVRATLSDVPPLDPNIFIILDLPVIPDGRLSRWDDAVGTRPATAEEIQAWDGTPDTSRIDLFTELNDAIGDGTVPLRLRRVLGALRTFIERRL